MTMKRSKVRTRNPEPGTLNRFLPILLVLAALAVYFNSLSAPFIFDDEVAVVSNPAIRSVVGALSQPRNTPLAGRPVAGLSFAVNFALSELDAAAYRATNIAIHAACGLLLFGLVRRTLSVPTLRDRYGENADSVAFAASLLWIVHPLGTDAVTYITQRTESLMALFYLLTVYASLRAYASPSRARWEVIAVASCALGMGTKESMVTAPVIVLLFDRVFLFDSVAQALRTRVRLYTGFALTWIILALQVAATPRSGSAGFATEVSVWTYLLNQAQVIVRYLRLAVWPTDQVINYGPPLSITFLDALPYAAIVVCLLAVTLVAFRGYALAGFLGAWFFITLAPTSSILPIATEVAAERRMYLPLMAIAVAVAAVSAGRLLRSSVPRAIPPVLLGVTVAALGFATLRRNGEHQSWLTLAQTTLERWPTDVAHAAVGGELARLRRDDEALPLLRVGARSDVRARYNLGITLFNIGRYEEAIRELELLVTQHPLREETPWARRVMGHAYARLSKWPDAITQLEMTIAMTPGDLEAQRLIVDSHNSYGVDLAQAQRYDAAITEFQTALKRDPGNASARYNLATALFDTRAYEHSFIEAERALSADPANADAHHLAGKLLALQGRMKEAVEHLETASKLNPRDEAISGDLARVRGLL